MYDLFHETEENGDDQASFKGLTEYDEENGDGKHVRGHGERRKEGRSCLRGCILGGGGGYKASESQKELSPPIGGGADMTVISSYPILGYDFSHLIRFFFSKIVPLV